DLLALQAGYRSANARLRADILAQFPILDIGFTRARDNTGVNSVGFGVTLRLPIFNGNRGKIAIDRATRKALNAAYQARLDEAANGVRAARQRLGLARRELAAVAAQLPALAQTAHATQAALARGDATRFQAFSAVSAWLDARIDADKLRANTAQLTLTLRTLLALPPPSEGTST
ncbi:MAG: TolC family protein, partial [Gammaproteobacteria bacterium]